MILPTTPIEEIPKINRKIIPALKRLGIKTIRDFLFHFPSRYENFSEIKKIADAVVNEIIIIQGQVQHISTIRTARRRMFITEAKIADESGVIKALWFNQPFLARTLKAGQIFNLSGKVTLGPRGIYLQNPGYERISGDETQFTLHTGRLVPIYPETNGITSRWLRFLVKSFMELRKNVSDFLPSETRERLLIPHLKDALLDIHFPKSIEAAERAQKRFAFENMLLIQLRALKERSRLKNHLAPAINLDLNLIKKFVATLPYNLTNAQRRALWEILQDISRPRPMNRLLEGDVGSGKTVVAAGAALATVRAGFTTVFMAPTEILARQHFDTLQKTLAPFKISIGLLTGSEKNTLNSCKVFVGTHALIQNSVKFENLGLVIIDEQHRFGVNQRAMLLRNPENTNSSFSGRNLIPHFLSMTATPIPRTLALAIYGDLDISILDEMPKARKPVVTKIVEQEKRMEAYQYIREEVKKGRQVFVVCPRIEAEGYRQKLLNVEVKAVKEEFKKLAEIIFPDLRVAMLHGKMKSKEKEEVMEKFKNQEYDILVSTSVIEVGVDVPNATIMIIEGAERFGLAQLHQFRGRVGRGAEQSYCFLFPTEEGMVTRRLRVMTEAKNGFELAEKDLKIRGPGDIFGERQWGIPNTTLAAFTDAKLFYEVRQEARELIKKSPDLSLYPLLRKRFNEFEKSIHFE